MNWNRKVFTIDETNIYLLEGATSILGGLFALLVSLFLLSEATEQSEKILYGLTCVLGGVWSVATYRWLRKKRQQRKSTSTEND